MDSMNKSGNKGPNKNYNISKFTVYCDSRAIYRLVLVCCLISLFERDVQST